jgi:PEP-CTERM motif-containing protein
MPISERNYGRSSFVLLLVIGFMACLQGSPANAYPILDQEIYYHGGPLQIEILTKEAAYTNQIYLHLNTNAGGLFLGNNTDTGLVINFDDPASIGLNPGQEFILGIHVVNTGNYFVMGSGADNPDGIPHATVSYVYNHVAIIGFEDLFGGGDLDYDDARIRVTGDIGIEKIPEPSTMLLFGSGLASLLFFRRRSK